MSRVLLGVSASVAVYKACDLASLLTQQGHAVRAVLTPRAAQLVAPQLFEAVTGEAAHVDEFDASRGSAMDHIQLADWGEVFVVAPATADVVGRLAHGLAGDLLTTLALALAGDVPRILSPAMNPRMLEQPAVQRNLERLAADGWQVLEPGEGHMACGDAGRGRLPEPDAIARAVGEALRS